MISNKPIFRKLRIPKENLKVKKMAKKTKNLKRPAAKAKVYASIEANH